MAPATHAEAGRAAAGPMEEAVFAADSRRVAKACEAARLKIAAAIAAGTAQEEALQRARAGTLRVEEALRTGGGAGAYPRRPVAWADMEEDPADSAAPAAPSAVAAGEAVDAVNEAVAAHEGPLPEAMRDVQRAAHDLLILAVASELRITMAELDRKGLPPVLNAGIEAAMGRTKAQDPDLYSRLGTAKHKLFVPRAQYSGRLRKPKAKSPSGNESPSFSSKSTISPSTSGDESGRDRFALGAADACLDDASAASSAAAPDEELGSTGADEADEEKIAALAALDAAGKWDGAVDLRVAALEVVEIGQRWVARWRGESVVLRVLSELMRLVDLACIRGEVLSWRAPETITLVQSVLDDMYLAEEAEHRAASDDIAACLRVAKLLHDRIKMPANCGHGGTMFAHGLWRAAPVPALW
mmetsp:Transcript_19999/g.57286  ORF Transcript_19999/g.57286 Transcript_19999/m.57286 type:complete len:414 (+) Transcript_19999:86-1327(+)